MKLRIITSVAAAAVLAVSLSACQQKTEEVATPPATDAAATAPVEAPAAPAADAMATTPPADAMATTPPADGAAAPAMTTEPAPK